VTAPPCGVVLAYERAGDTGGVAVDVRHLAQGLPAAGARPVVARTARAAIGAMRGRSPALLHVFGCLPSSLIFRLLPVARAARWRVVWTPVFHPSRPRSWRGYGLLRAMQAFDLAAPRVARFVDAVIAATEEEAALFERLGARRVALIPPGVAGVSTAGGNGAPPELRAELGLAPGPVVLVVGRDNRRKGLPFALQSFAGLRRLRPDAQLLLVGPPADRLATGVPGVHSRGWLPAGETERAYRAADLLLVSSLYEGLPRVVIEAWREGLPVVATDRVALAPTIAGVGGEIVPYGDAERTASVMARLLADPATLARYGAAGRRLVAERFLLSRLVAETADLYRELCGDPRA
jgi:glycosyltransferase involved in cell wall biosynthesis